MVSRYFHNFVALNNDLSIYYAVDKGSRRDKGVNK